MSKLISIVLLLCGFAFGQTIAINEYLASSDLCCDDGVGEMEDFVEVHNYGDEPFDLAGLYFTDGGGGSQIPDGFPETIVPAGGFISVIYDRDLEQGPLHINAKLSSGGEAIVIFAADSVEVIDSLSFGEQHTDISNARFPDYTGEFTLTMTPTPGEANAIDAPLFGCTDPAATNYNPEADLDDGSCDYAPALYINEFMADNDVTIADEFGEFEDWIEIYNPNEMDIDLGGLYLTDDLLDLTMWQIPDTSPTETTVPAGGFLLLWADRDMEQGILHLDLKLSSGGEEIGLVAADGVTIVDSYVFGPQTLDISKGRLPDGNDYWVFFDVPTPDASNGEMDVPELYINEFIASNDTGWQDPDDQDGDPFEDWAEIYNPNSFSVDLGGMYMADGHLELHLIPIGDPVTVVPAGGFLIVYFDDEPEDGPLHIPEKLGGGGDEIYLYAADGVTLIDSYIYGIQTTDISEGRLPDGSDTWTFFDEPTPGTSNGAVEVPPLFINEFIASNDTGWQDPDDQDDDPFEDWVEIYNPNDFEVDLGGMFMADGHLELHMIPTDDPVTIVPAGGFLIVYFDDEPEDGPLHIPEKLGSGGDEIYLYAQDGLTLIDSYIFGEQITDVSFGRAPDGANFWIYFEEPTPGATNGEIPPSELFINEFIASNDTGWQDPDDQDGDPFEDWAEIYNPGLMDVDLGGMYMADGHLELHQIPVGDPATIVPAGGFLIVYFDDEPEDGPLHIPEKLGSGGDEIYLYDVDGVTLIDFYIYDEQTTDVSEGRFPDGTDNWEFFETPTPGSTNVLPCPADGDANLDGSTDILDVVMIVGYILGSVEFNEDNLCHSDVNEDGSGDILDVVQVVSWILGSPRHGNAVSAQLMINDTGAILSADGYVGAVQMTLSHGYDFKIELTDNALVADHVTNNGTTELVIIAPENGQLFTTDDSYQIESVIAATIDGYIDVHTASEFALFTSYPNPFNPSTIIHYSIPTEGNVNIVVFDIAGRKVAELVNGYSAAGYNSVIWNASQQASGIYLINLQADGINQTQKVMLMK